jgi:hypothetical protein
MVRERRVPVLIPCPARTLRRRTAAIALLLALAAARRASAADTPPTEYQVKAAFLCKFGSYVDWPPAASAADAFVIAVHGPEELVAEVASAARGQNVSGRPIVVRTLAAGASLDGVAIVYIARTSAAQQDALLAAARGRPILTVTESERAVDSMLNFVVVDSKVRFDIALAPVERGGLKISSRLLAVARSVSGSRSS